MESPVTERMCKERHDLLGDKVDSIKDELKNATSKLMLIWVGNGQVGVKHKIDTMWISHERKQKSTQGWMDWGFRLVIVTMLGIMMAHMGMK